jgi:hypothetical protein
MYLSLRISTVELDGSESYLVIAMAAQPSSRLQSRPKVTAIAARARDPEPKLFRKLISELPEAYPKRLWRLILAKYASGAGRQG